MATKLLNFYSYNLQKDTYLMLMFHPPNNDKLYIDQFPVAWKVISFRAKDHSKASVHYAARLAFGYAQTDQNSLVNSAAWVEVMSGDITSVSGNQSSRRFDPRSAGSGTKLIVCKNNTNSRANLSVGFVRGDKIDQRYEPALVWADVGAKSSITAQFTPVVSAYVTRDYQATQLIRGEVETEPIWTRNLNELNDATGWMFTEDEENGSFDIQPALGP